jgi:queuine tRNA-ribosyltransferase
VESAALYLLAGWYVGAGDATGEKEETTVAATSPDLIQRPLDHAWLERAHRSTSAEPLRGDMYQQAPLSALNRERLAAHPQFQ